MRRRLSTILLIVMMVCIITMGGMFSINISDNIYYSLTRLVLIASIVGLILLGDARGDWRSFSKFDKAAAYFAVFSFLAIAAVDRVEMPSAVSRILGVFALFAMGFSLGQFLLHGIVPRRDR